MIDLTAGRQFIEEHRESRVVIIPHTDADGLAGTALLQRVLAGTVDVLAPGKGDGIHTLGFQAMLAEAKPSALVVVDEIARAAGYLPGVPTLIIDHHHPEALPPHVVMVNSYAQPVAETSAHLCYHLVGQPPELIWLAAIGTLGDYGRLAPATLVREAAARFGISTLMEVIALINAARRSSRYDWPMALALLREYDDPRRLLESDRADVRQLRADRQEVNDEFRRVRRAQPVFVDPWAVIAFSSPCLVHPALATTWVRRLSAHTVVAANYGYRPNYVHFSMRTTQQDDLAAEIAQVMPDNVPEAWFHGHHHAVGGALPRADFAILLNRLGFTPEQLLALERSALSH